MSRTARVTRMEAAMAAMQHRQPMDWEAHGPLGSLTHECISLFLHREDPLDAHGHQLMMAGAVALDCLTGRPVPEANARALSELMANPDYQGHGYSERKHPKAAELFEMLAAGGWLSAAGRAGDAGGRKS